MILFFSCGRCSCSSVLLACQVPLCCRQTCRPIWPWSGATVYPSPTAAPIEDAVIVIHDGKIVDIGPDGRVKVPKGLPFIDCRGKVITAGFWNSHVHFTEPCGCCRNRAPAKLERHMQEMLTRWGFTTVFDIGSNPYHTLPCATRRRRRDSRARRSTPPRATSFRRTEFRFMCRKKSPAS